MARAEIGILGGSGLYQLPNIRQPRYVEMTTPFGEPSEKFMIGELGGKHVAFLSRHGIGHRLNPSEINYQANLFAMKLLGVKKLISVNAVGSLKENLKPMHLVLPDQFVDHTHNREKTFFSGGIAAHVSMAEPICPHLLKLAGKIAKKTSLITHKGGTYYNMEGPQFSSKAESMSYRKMGYSVIGMTMATEAKLARELEMCYVTLAFVTDYDCWHKEESAVSVEKIIRILNKNAENSSLLVEKLIQAIDPADEKSCSCGQALQNAIITSPGKIPAHTLQKLHPILEKYINA